MDGDSVSHAGVQWISSEGPSAPLPAHSPPLATDRFTAQLVILLVVACVALSLYDMYLVLVGLM